MDDYVDLGTVSSKGFVDRIINYFIDRVMKAHFTGGTDVHGRALAYCLEAFENLDTG